MSVVLHVLFYAAVAGSVTSTIYCGMVLVAAVRFGIRKRREDRAVVLSLPPVSLLKPLHGSEDGLERNLETFFEQDYPAPFEIVFCARHESDPGLQLARRVGARYPQVQARYITCGEPEFPNAKMWSLAKLSEAAQFETLVTSDADARVKRSYLRECLKGLADGTEFESCMYLGRTDGGLVSALDAVGKSVEMTGGVLVADMLEGTKFALGVTMVLRRKAFFEAGGYDELGQYWAEDFVLGHRLAEKGFRVGLSSHVIELMVPPSGFWPSFRNQVRWMKSTRRSRPAGHLGTGLTFAVPYGLIGLLWGLLSGHWLGGVVWVMAMCLNRSVMAMVVLLALGGEGIVRGSLLYPLRDLLGGVLWVASYCGSTMFYHGGLYRLTAGGRFQRQASTSSGS